MRKHFGQSLRIGVAPGALALATAAWLGRQGSAHRRRTGHRQRRSRRHRSHRRQACASCWPTPRCSNWPKPRWCWPTSWRACGKWCRRKAWPAWPTWKGRPRCLSGPVRRAKQRAGKFQ
ncbi:hypothetical protein LP420_07900 [Massilia sp. B-10]|nr:hypothetical protein LP420_07900 [Massilia sp. B-10]